MISCSTFATDMSQYASSRALAGLTLCLVSLFSATLTAEQADHVVIHAGKLADIIAVPGDPLTDSDQFGKVHFVMKGGEVHRLAGAD